MALLPKMAKPMKSHFFAIFFAFFRILGWVTGEISPHRVPQAYSGGGVHPEMPRSVTNIEKIVFGTLVY